MSKPIKDRFDTFKYSRDKNNLYDKLVYPDPNAKTKTEAELYQSLLAAAFQSPRKFLSSKRQREMKEVIKKENFLNLSTEKEVTYSDSVKLSAQHVLSNHIPPKDVEFTKGLDTPNLTDDFYLNLLDWGHDKIAIAIVNQVYLVDPVSDKFSKFDFGRYFPITCVKWNLDSTHTMIGFDNNTLLDFDVAKQKIVHEYKEFFSRIPNVAFQSEQVMSVCSYHSIYLIDTRTNKSVARLNGHRQEVVGLSWDNQGSVLATGSNDNAVYLWDSRKFELLKKLGRHRSAVKAIDWNPRKFNELITGGGYLDKTIKVWNTVNFTEEMSFETDSQVTNIRFLKDQDLIVSTHGFTDSTVKLWDSKTKEKVKEVDGNKERVNYLAVNREHNKFATAGAENVIKFFSVKTPKINRYTCSKALVFNNI